MLGLHVADIFVLVLYLLGMAVIGFWSARKIEQSHDFFMPRRFGKAMMVMFGFGAGTHSDQAVGVASKSFSSGLSGIWYQWLWLPCTPFYWLIAPVMRRFRAITTGDVFEARYDRSVAMLYAVIGMLNLSVNIGVMLRGSSEVISASTQGLLSANVAIAVMTVVFVVYGVAGGLGAAIITDFIQGILTIIFSFLLLPLVMNAVGWMDGIRAGIADPGKLSLVAPAGIGFFYIGIIALNGLVGIVTQPHTMGNCAAGRTEMDGRFGWMFGNIIKRICTVPWCLTGLAAVVYFGSKGIQVEPDKVFGAVAGDFLPKVMPGVLGVFLAALLASVMSSCDAFMISSAGLFTENIYRPLVPTKGHHHYVTVGRIASVGVVSGGVAFAYWLPGVVAGLEIFWKVSAMMGLAFWLGLFWRRTTSAGAWAATLISFAVMLFTSKISSGSYVLWDFDAHCAQYLPEFMLWQGKLYLPWQMILYLSAGLIGGIIVSLLTRPVAGEKLDNFYALIRTPVRPGEQPSAPCTLPEGAVVPAKRNLFPNTSLEIMVPSRTSVAGFVAGWIFVAAIVITVYLIAG
ncbi:MAG TPA: sodium:solute symporter family protein [Sedimentisphaerales bacterium]|nr:sodium:solute symporter family protein [Sedimentisphaerales bacterium]